MSEEEELVAQIAAQIEAFMGEYGFTQLRHPDRKVLILYRPPNSGKQNAIERRIAELVAARGKRANFEWSTTNFEKLSINLLDPNEIITGGDEAYFQIPGYKLCHAPITPEIVKGKIGANVAGRTQVYVRKDDNEDVYVTLADTGKYIECDATELPDGIKLYYGFSVLVDKNNRVIVAADTSV